MRLPAQVQVGRKDGWSSNDRIRLIGSLTERVPQGALSYFSVSVAGTASAGSALALLATRPAKQKPAPPS